MNEYQKESEESINIRKISEGQKKIRKMFKFQKLSFFFRRSGHPDPHAGPAPANCNRRNYELT
jgi:hypothetical protein